MRKSITLLFAVMVAMAAFAHKGEVPQLNAKVLPTSHPKEAMVKAQGIDRTATAMPKKVSQKASSDELVTLPDGVSGVRWYFADGSLYVYDEYWIDYTEAVKPITVAFDGNDVYIRGLAYWFEEAWIKGVRDGDTVTFPASTFVGEDDYGKEYFVGCDDHETACPIVFTYNENAGTLTCETSFIAEAPEAGGMSWFSYYTDVVLSTTPPVPDLLTQTPENLETESWLFTAVDLSYDNNDNPVYEDVQFNVQLGFNGNDVYIQGLCSYIPEAWIKGVRDGNKLTFATGQYLGVYFDYYNLYFIGYDNGVCDVTFTMNTEETRLTSDQWVVINGKKSRLYYYNIFTEPKLSKISEVAAVPAAPWVKSSVLTGKSPKLNLFIPLVDVNGNPMISDKLYYKLYTEIGTTVTEYECSTDDYEEIEQNMIEIPYDFNDDWDIYPGGNPIYVYGDVNSWRRVGVQSIYYGGDERNVSEISWYVVPCDLYVAGSFTDPAWADGKQLMTQGDDGKYTIDVELPENAEFKLLDSRGNWIGGVTDGNNFSITQEQIANGTELSCAIPGMNFVMPFAGKYTLTADLDNLKLVVAASKPCAPTAIILNATDADEVALRPNCTFQLSVESVEPEGANAEVTWMSSDERIATVDETGLVTGKEFDGNVIKDGRNRVPTDNDDYGYFPVTITATTTSDMDTPTSASVQVWVKSSSPTGVNVVSSNAVESVKYVNVVGVESNRPHDGINIVVTRYTDGTTKTTKMVK